MSDISVRLTELELKVGYPANRSNSDRLLDEFAKDLDKRQAAIEWVIANGIPRRAAEKAYSDSIAKAYASDGYLRSWRDRVNPRWSTALRALEEGDGDDGFAEAEDKLKDVPKYSPSATALASLSTDDIARAADAVIGKRLEAAERRLSSNVQSATLRAVEQAVAGLTLTLKPEDIERIRRIATDAGRAEIERLMPPRRLEIVNHESKTTTDLGIQHEEFPRLLRACQARNSDGNRLNILLSGPPGTGKTTAGSMVSKALGLDFGSDSSLDADFKVTGYMDANGHAIRTEFWRIWTEGGVYVADEIDNWNPSALVALNPAFGNGWMTFPDGLRKRHKDTIIIACANTWGLGATNDFVGRTRLDAASRDRLQPKIAWGIDEKLEHAIAVAQGGTEGSRWCEIVQGARRKAKEFGLQVLVTPRATFTGIGLLAQGFTIDEAIAMTMTADISAEQRKQLGLDEPLAHLSAPKALAGDAA